MMNKQECLTSIGLLGWARPSKSLSDTSRYLIKFSTVDIFTSSSEIDFISVFVVAHLKCYASLSGNHNLQNWLFPLSLPPSLKAAHLTEKKSVTVTSAPHNNCFTNRHLPFINRFSVSFYE